MRALLTLALALPLVACSTAIRRPVWTTDAATALEQVTRTTHNEFDPAISPDGSALAYDTAESPDAKPHVEVMALAGAGTTAPVRTLYSSKDTLGFEPAWMPDGSGLIFVSTTRGSGQGLVQTIGPSAARTNFLADAGDPYLVAEWPAMSPNGKTMAMSLVNLEHFETGWRSSRAFDRGLGLSDLLGTGTTVLGGGMHPAWSPDGARIAFTRATDGHAHLFVANADGSGAHQITEGMADDIEPSWSPDGQFIVFSSAHGQDHWMQANLFAVRTDGSGLIQLTEGDRFVGRPTWARDGFVYFHANASDKFHIWRVRPMGAFAAR